MSEINVWSKLIALAHGTHPSGKPNIGDEGVDVAGEEVAQTQESHEQHRGGGGHLVNLDHGQNFGHLTFQRSGVEQSKIL